MRTQFYDKVTTDTTHPLHHTLNKALPHRNIKTIPFTHFTNKLDTIPVAPSGTNKATHTITHWHHVPSAVSTTIAF